MRRLAAGTSALLAAGCPDYSATDASLYNATAFSLNIRLSSAAVTCDADSGALEARDFSPASCVELPAEGSLGLPKEPDADACEVALVETAGLPSTLLLWSWRPRPAEISHGHPDPDTVYLERVGDLLVLAGAPRVSAEEARWALPAPGCGAASSM